jgi:PAS domain-containing protein
MTPPKDKIESLAQEMLAAGEEHVQIAHNPSRVVFWVAGPDGACELVSPNWSELTGQPVDEATGTGWLRRIAPPVLFREFREERRVNVHDRPHVTRGGRAACQQRPRHDLAVADGVRPAAIAAARGVQIAEPFPDMRQRRGNVRHGQPVRHGLGRVALLAPRGLKVLAPRRAVRLPFPERKACPGRLDQVVEEPGR